jgi:predicted nucleic acid-binding protein
MDTDISKIRDALPPDAAEALIKVLKSFDERLRQLEDIDLRAIADEAIAADHVAAERAARMRARL